MVQFCGGGYAADAHIGSVVVVSPEPFGGVILGLFYAFDDVLIQPFMPDGSVVTLNVSILLWLAGLDMIDLNVARLSPIPQFATDIFRAVINADCLRLAAPFNDPVQATNDPRRG